MRRIDRYILKECAGPFLYGVGIFMVIILGAQLTPWLVRLMVKEGYPADVILRIFFLRLPGVIVMTLPMATVFASVMSMSNLSASGEIIALRAGGLSFPRISGAVLGMGLVLSVVSLGLNEIVVPYCTGSAADLVMAHASTSRPLEYFTFSIPTKGKPQRVVYARLFDPQSETLKDLTIWEMKDGRFYRSFSAEEATWHGTTWELRNVEHTVVNPDRSQFSQKIARMTHDIGKNPAELRKVKKDLVDMSMAELRDELAKRIRLKLPYRPDVTQVLQTIHLRWAAPWVTVGFALIGAPLGLRPTRATTGIGLGLSLMIVFAYYVIFNTLVIIGNQGGLPPVVAAWVPNLIVYAAGLGLYFNATR